MSFVYPRRITISRPNVDGAAGVQPYAGLSPTNEKIIDRDVPASIQLVRLGKPPLGHLPSDTEGRGTWRILFKLPRGRVQERDVITDDLGVRYGVANAYWNSLGYSVLAEMLKT